MLKIKDNVDLKELEKFGFQYVENKRSINNMDCSYYKKLIGSNITLIISIRHRELSSDCTEKESFTYLFSDGFDILFDLIQAGLVEKV